MPAGYSGTPLAKKLGIKPGMTIAALAAPVGYRELLAPLPDGVGIVDKLPREAAFVHLFASERGTLESELARIKAALASDGVVWISWPKKSSGVASELAGNVVRSLGLDAGLVDIKVCAVDETWSGLKFVYRLEDR